jgi:nitrite reductase/ring-hydroxylating ferredoxin subunit
MANLHVLQASQLCSLYPRHDIPGNSPLCRRITSRSLAFAAQKRALICLSQKGFGSNTAKPKKKGKGSFQREDPSWKPVANISVFEGRDIKAVDLKDKTICCLYNVQGAIYCSDANSTAYKFPLTNAKIIQRDGSPAVEVALDGTVYDLKTGKVLAWCPKNNPLRAVLRAIKNNSTPEDLKVYPTQLDEDSGQIYVKFK